MEQKQTIEQRLNNLEQQLKTSTNTIAELQEAIQSADGRTVWHSRRYDALTEIFMDVVHSSTRAVADSVGDKCQLETVINSLKAARSHLISECDNSKSANVQLVEQIQASSAKHNALVNNAKALTFILRNPEYDFWTKISDITGVNELLSEVANGDMTVKDFGRVIEDTYAVPVSSKAGFAFSTKIVTGEGGPVEETQEETAAETKAVPQRIDLTGYDKKQNDTGESASEDAAKAE